MSHFIEHLIFKGSDRFSAWDIARIFDDIGGEPNASTSKEHTLVNARFLDDDLAKAFEVIAEMVARPSFAELDQEREVVLEEVAMYEDSPQELIHDDMSEVLFDDHPLGRPIIGHAESLERIDLADRARLSRRALREPGHRSLGGRARRSRRALRAGRAHFRPDPGAVVPQAELSPPGLRHVASFREKDTEQYHVCLGGPGPRRGDPDRYAVFVVDTILGSSWSSRLFQEVRERRGLAYSVYSYVSLYADAGHTGIYCGSREEAIEEAMDVILGVLHDFEQDVAEEAIQRAKNHLKGQHVLSMESPGARMQSQGRAVLTNQPVLTIDEVLARIDAVTHDDVMAAVRRYYDPQKWSAVCIGPRAEPFRAVTEGFEWEER